MKYDNFMLGDLVGTLAAFSLFTLFLLIPGYVLGWLTNVLSFRQRIFTTKIVLSLTLSVAVCPVATYLLARLFSFDLVWFFYSAIWLIFLVLVASSFRRSGIPNITNAVQENWLPILIFAVWIFIATLSLIDLQLGKHLYISVVAYDYMGRISVTDAITRTGVPPINPEFFPGYPIELFYYYFWFLMCSLVDRLGGTLIGPRVAVIAGTEWLGIALIAILLLYLRFFEPNGKKHIRTKAIIGICLLLVTGLDIIPVLAEDFLKITTGHGRFYPAIEWWNTQSQITAWLGAMLWVPNHIAGFVACLSGILLLRSIQKNSVLKDKFLGIFISGFAFASAVGLSIWVTFVAAVFLVVWMLICLKNKWHSEAVLLALIGLVATLLSIPYLLDLHRANHLNLAPIALSVRSFEPALRIFDHFGIKDGWLVMLTNLLLLPLNYLIELGFFAIAAILYWKQRLRLGNKLSREDIFYLAMLSTSVIICTFLKSTIKNNDLGWRGLMFAQFVLLIWSIDFITSLLKRIFKNRKTEELRVQLNVGYRIRNIVAVLLILGTLGTVYDITMLRTAVLLVDIQSPQLHLGRRAYAVRQAYQWINHKLSVAAIIQHNPNVSVDIFKGLSGNQIDVFNGLYGNHQVVASDYTYGTMYGIPDSFYNPIASSISEIFSIQVELKRVDDICHNFLIDALVVKDADKVWKNTHSWVWQRKPMFSNDFSRVFSCGKLAEEMRAMSIQSLTPD